MGGEGASRARPFPAAACISGSDSHSGRLLASSRQRRPAPPYSGRAHQQAPQPPWSRMGRSCGARRAPGGRSKSWSTRGGPGRTSSGSGTRHTAGTRNRRSPCCHRPASSPHHALRAPVQRGRRVCQQAAAAAAWHRHAPRQLSGVLGRHQPLGGELPEAQLAAVGRQGSGAGRQGQGGRGQWRRVSAEMPLDSWRRRRGSWEAQGREEKEPTGRLSQGLWAARMAAPEAVEALEAVHGGLVVLNDGIQPGAPLGELEVVLRQAGGRAQLSVAKRRARRRRTGQCGGGARRDVARPATHQLAAVGPKVLSILRLPVVEQLAALG